MAGDSHLSFASLHDVELAARAALGERPAFGELVRRHGGAVRGLLRRMGASPATADDVAQDAFLSAFEHVGEFRGQGSFAGWVRTIAVRLYLRRLRRERRLRDLAVVEEDAQPPAPSSEARLDLDDALKELSEAERICVSLCHGAGMSHAQAAEVLGLPLGTVKSHVRRGLQNLRARLAPEAAPAERRRGDGG